jgi:hypothetical protein
MNPLEQLIKAIIDGIAALFGGAPQEPQEPTPLQTTPFTAIQPQTDDRLHRSRLAADSPYSGDALSVSNLGRLKIRLKKPRFEIRWNSDFDNTRIAELFNEHQILSNSEGVDFLVGNEWKTSEESEIEGEHLPIKNIKPKIWIVYGNAENLAGQKIDGLPKYSAIDPRDPRSMVLEFTDGPTYLHALTEYNELERLRDANKARKQTGQENETETFVFDVVPGPYYVVRSYSNWKLRFTFSELKGMWTFTRKGPKPWDDGAKFNKITDNNWDGDFTDVEGKWTRTKILKRVVVERGKTSEIEIGPIDEISLDTKKHVPFEDIARTKLGGYIGKSSKTIATAISAYYKKFFKKAWEAIKGIFD